MEITLKKYIYKNKEINLTINNNLITGIIGNSIEDFLALLSLSTLSKGTYLFNENKVTKENINVFQKRISYIKEDITILPFLTTVKDYFLYEIKNKNLIFKNLIKKITDSLKIVGLSANYLERNYITLSTSEKKLISLALALINNPTIIIINEPFKNMDLKNEKKIINLLIKLKDQYQKTIILASSNSNVLYKYTTEVILFKNDEIFFKGPPTEIFFQVEKLKNNDFAVPEIIEFTYLAKKLKNVKLDYHKDIRDIIKDIYKHI